MTQTECLVGAHNITLKVTFLHVNRAKGTYLAQTNKCFTLLAVNLIQSMAQHRFSDLLVVARR
eukprot:3609379-Prorocentrum_lima.AAC.1